MIRVQPKTRPGVEDRRRNDHFRAPSHCRRQRPLPIRLGHDDQLGDVAKGAEPAESPQRSMKAGVQQPIVRGERWNRLVGKYKRVGRSKDVFHP